jgi:hypothetical protein
MGFERNFSAGYFRKRAEEFRTKADNCEHEQSRNTLLNVAKTYDTLAHRAERIRAVSKPQ